MALWGLGLVLILFGAAGLAIDTWRVLAERQALAGLADSASIAGATAIDVEAFRADGTVQLDPRIASDRAVAYIVEHAPDLDDDIVPAIAFPNDGIEVTLSRDVELTLVGVFLPDGAVSMRVSAYSIPGERVGP